MAPTPKDLVVLTRDRLQDVLDDAVARGRMTPAAASELLGEIIRRGRGLTGDVIADAEQLLGRSRDEISRRVPGSAFPIDGYEELTAAEVTARLTDLTPAELRKVRDHERRNANRKSVLNAIEKTLG
jgi:hypothetical protein